ncbi:MAG TPA: SUMF1/EgtB/PvdO family nonheme iron enzyme [Candidatus Acidoferrum sp.]|nr:SUMF1/EgtB/PvdO family nonheme iron enzyme [Candidatus Acidoferrum sp.]
MQVSNGAVWLRLTGDVGSACTIQWAGSLAGDVQWQTLTNLDPLSNSPTWIEDTGAGPAPRFYRAFSRAMPSSMPLIPAGSFTMGDTMGDANNSTNDWPSESELPAHTVYVSAFHMDQYLVTSNLWLKVKAWEGGNGYSYDDPGSAKASNHPVQTVNWYDVVKWCNARSEMEGLTPCYYTDSGMTTVYKTGDDDNLNVNWGANGYRLPTEAEWEKAARGGLSGHRFPWGDTISESQADYYSEGTNNYSYDLSDTTFNPAFATGDQPYTSPVGSFAPNGYGLYDMAGDVSEWCWDWWSLNYYSQSPGTDPRGPASSGSYYVHVLRGGHWYYTAFKARCACRYYLAPSSINIHLGFRCVRGL